MECPYCETELICSDEWGYFASHQSGEKLGDIYECPTARGEDPEKCESACFNGLFHTYVSTNELEEGYPC